ncbi:unnamed protein product [Toxocara canis]|uniref:Chitin-binding type-2 domain-containing protein n=1 Tax=Toxocara canis TaxID=6265 RepID=A0A183U7U2_TOXCA|nr:unnamed protein product [Toxocara canis]
MSTAFTVFVTFLALVKPCRRHYGFFGIGCSSRYVVCIDGLPTYHTCRRGLTFDERRRTCLPKHLVKPCGIGPYGQVPVEVGEAY